MARMILNAFAAAAVGLVGCLASLDALAQDVTLRLHQFLPAQANVPTASNSNRADASRSSAIRPCNSAARRRS